MQSTLTHTRTGWAVALAVSALAAPPPGAAAEDPQRIAVPNSSRADACADELCRDYQLIAGRADGVLKIRPRDGARFDAGEIAYFVLPPPVWPHDTPQGYEAVVDFSDTAVGSGSHWRALACRSARGADGPSGRRCEGRVHVSGAGVVQAVNLLAEEQDLLFGLQYIGSTGSPTVTRIAAQAIVRWREVDTAPPALSDATAGDGAAGALAWLTSATGTQLSFAADDNTDVATKTITLDGRLLEGEEPVLPDGRGRVEMRACDIAGNCARTGFDAQVDTNPPAATLAATRFGRARPDIVIRATDPPKDGFASGLSSVSIAVGDDEEGDASVFEGVAQRTEGGFVLVPASPVPEGIYDSFVTRVRDRAGNASAPSIADEVIVDLSPPGVTPTYPAPRAVVASGPITIAAAVSDRVRVDSATLQLDGLTRATEFVEGDAAVEFVVERVCPGSHRVRATATDPVGRTAAATWRFSVRGRMTPACRRERRCTAARAGVERANRRLAAARRRADRRRIGIARRSLSRRLRARGRACR